ncbi:hypothetical protein TSOC_006165 [Tetrabaena socialis]|uniref:Uncharacterized protein n=1 Tax=Tetrabaena socialis TaxID=47790 RepID=A0A2J8A4E5_9CHLO|nr:hypothetical protein TSOC_006165 [Tetrabaena socialis]|eukprot:PNH07378.1 hypothetical protein TSOC_006165 [Tetrabaena socialis]
MPCETGPDRLASIATTPTRTLPRAIPAGDACTAAPAWRLPPEPGPEERGPQPHAASHPSRARHHPASNRPPGGSFPGGNSIGTPPARPSRPSPLAQQLSTAGALLLLAVLHPDAAAAVGPALAAPGLAAAAAAAAVAVVGQTATLRVENAGDIVPTLPLGGAWRHVGLAQSVQACGPLAAATTAITAATATATATTAIEEEGAGGATEAASGGDGWAQALAQAEAAGAESTGEGVAAGELPARRRSGRLLRSTSAGDATGGGDGARAVAFPFPFVVQDHMIQTYVRVMFSCLPGAKQRLVPGPEDPYAA